MPNVAPSLVSVQRDKDRLDMFGNRVWLPERVKVAIVRSVMRSISTDNFWIDCAAGELNSSTRSSSMMAVLGSEMEKFLRSHAERDRKSEMYEADVG